MPSFSSITLSETATLTLFALPSLRYATGGAVVGGGGTSSPAPVSASPYALENEAYAALLLAKKDRDRYVPAFAQTLNASLRSRGVQVSERETVSEGVQASSWMMWEAERALDEDDPSDDSKPSDDPSKAASAPSAADDDDEALLAGADAALLLSPRDVRNGGDTSRSDHSVSSQGSSQSSALMSGLSHASTATAATAVAASAAGPPPMVLSASLMAVLNACEEAVLQNVHHHAQLLYRNLAPSPSPSGGDAPPQTSGLVHLFTFPFPASLGPALSCTSMSFNRSNVDLLAVGYGSYSYRTSLQPGKLLFWSFHNASFPHRSLSTPSSVLCVDFSTESPHLLAVGLASGDVCIYDMRDLSTSAPALQSRHATGKHREAVWQVKWVKKDRGEILMSISSDGSILQWSMKKGLIPKPVMSLKRGQESREGLSREGSGMCFDFPLASGNANASAASQYYAGTEDGVIHRCSVSYNEQVLESYVHHTGGVYAIRCNAFVPDIFLSCSHDWTIALWTARQETPIAVMGVGGGGSDVMDVVWNPVHATVFAVCTRDGRVEVWDVEVGVLDPVMGVETGGAGQCVVWGGENVLLVGDERGRVEVYRVEGRHTARETLTAEEQASRLEEVCYKHQHTKQQL